MVVGKCNSCYEEKEMFINKHGKQLKVCAGCYEQFYLPHCKSKEEIRGNRLLAEKRAQRKRQQAVLEYLKENPCMDCGEDNILVLEFDHRDPKDKKKQISEILSGGSNKQLKEEIDKCDVVCSNCHKIRTAKMFGNWRLEFYNEGENY